MSNTIKVGNLTVKVSPRGKRLEAKVRLASGQRKSFYGFSVAEIQEKVDAEIGFVQSLDTLDGFYAEVFLPTIIGLQPETIDKYAWAFDKHLRPKFGSRRLESITRHEIQDFFNGIPLAPGSKQQLKSKFSTVLKLAVEDGYIDKNPASSVRVGKVPRIKTIRATYEEAACCLDWPEPWAQVARIGLITGARIGEIMGLTRSDIKDGVLHINKQRHRREGMKGQTKSSDDRFIALPAHAVSEILGYAGPVFLVSYEDGRPPAVSHAQGRVSELFGPGYSAHKFRHMLVSLLENELEAPRRVVSAIVGHADQDVTSRYSHSNLEQQRRWLERHWEKLLSTSPVVQSVVK